MPLIGDRYRGVVYCALNPVYARQPLSGRRAALYGGRFNRKNRPALYTALTPDGALREANQVGTLQPTTLIAYRADIAPVFDGSEAAALADYDIDAAGLAAADWRLSMLNGQLAATQAFAERLIAAGFAGLLVPRFARGAAANALNLVLWRWNTGEDDRLDVVDDEGRLS